MEKSTKRACEFDDSELHELRLALLIRYIKEGFGMSTGGRKFKLNEEFWNWLNDANDKNPFSFENSCSALGYNAKYLRYLLTKKLAKTISNTR